MANEKKYEFYTTVDRYVNGEYVRGTPSDPVKVDFGPGFNPAGRIVRLTGKRVEMVKVDKEIDVVSPRGEKFKTKVQMEIPHEVEGTIEKFVEFTKAELAANGLIKVEVGKAPEIDPIKPHYAGGTTGGAPPAHTMDKAGDGRPSDREPSK